MSTPQLLKTIQNQDQEIRRLRQELQNRNSINYEEKYKKALKSIEQIIKANKQIKEQLDALRLMRQNQMETLNQFQKQQFKKAYDAVLKEKNVLVISMQSIQLENEKLKYTISELQNQISLLKNQKIQRNQSQREIQLPNFNGQGLGLGNIENSAKKLQKDISQLLRQKQEEFHRTLQNYEEHHANLSRNNKRLEQKIGQLEVKLTINQKHWRNKFEAKQIEVINVKSATREQFSTQISALRKENSALKINNNDLMLKVQNWQKNMTQQTNYQNFDWQADLVQQMIAVKANLQPLRQQISQLQELNIYQKEQAIRQKINLRTHVLELQSQVQRQKQTIKSMERKIIDSHQSHVALQEKANLSRKLEQENQLLNGKVIVMQSREIALRNRTGEQLQERVLQFENRIQLLLNNKQGLKQLRQVGIHQLLALKAYIMQLDAKLKQLVSSNAYLTKKYKSYKQKYQNSLRQHKQYEITINSLKMKILGYDKLVLKLQQELECTLRSSDHEIGQTYVRAQFDQNLQIYKKKYQMVKEKLQIQQKYKEQEIQTICLSYETKIMELTIKVQEIRSLKETLQLYRNKNEQIQSILTKKQNELYQSKMTSSKAAASVEAEQSASNRQTKDIISSLHLTIKQNDEKFFKLQSELRTKEDAYKRTILKLERDLQDIKEEFDRQYSKRELQKNLSFEQQIKKYKLKINDLEHQLHLLQATNKEEHHKVSGDFEAKLRRLQLRVQEVQNQRQQEIFNKRRLEKQILDLTRDKQQLERTVAQSQARVSQIQQLKRQNQNLRNRQTVSSFTYASSKPESSYSEYEMQSKQNIIRKLNNQIIQLKSTIGEYSDKDITISSLKNEVFYLKKEIEQLNDTINKYNNQILFLKGNLDNNRNNYNSGLESLIEEKDNLLSKVRKEMSNKDIKIRQLENQCSNLQQAIRKLRRQLSQADYLRQEMERMQRSMSERDSINQRLKMEVYGYEQQLEIYKKQNSFIKQNYQKLNYQLLEKQDQISRLGLQLNTVSLRSKEQYQTKFNQELLLKQKQHNKLNSDYLTLKSNTTMLEQDRNYQQENCRRANSQLLNLRNLINQLQEQKAALENQLYYKSQQVNKLQFSVQNYENDILEYTLKIDELSKLRNEIYNLKIQNSALQDEVYNKEGNFNRVIKQLNYIKEQYNQLEEQHNYKADTLNKLNYELNATKVGFQQTESSLQERDAIINKLNMDLTTAKNRFRDLQQEMQERQQQLTNITQQINQMKANMSYYEDDIADRNNQITRLTNQREVLKAEILRLNEVITEKNMEVNRARQEVFSLKLQVSQAEYQNQLRFEQQIVNYKNRVTQIQNELGDKDGQLRRLNIQLETSRYKPAPVGQVFSEQEVQELRNEVNKKQRQLINIKFDMEDKQFMIQSANNTLAMLKNTVTELQDTLESERSQYESIVREFTGKERKYNDAIAELHDEIQRLQMQTQRQKPRSYGITYSEEEMAEVQLKITQKQNEITQLKSQINQQQYYIQNLSTKISMQEKLIKELQLQNAQDRSRAEQEIQEYIKRQRNFRQQMAQLQETYHSKIYQFQQEHQQTIYNLSANHNEQYDYNVVIKAHVDQIDRLTKIVGDLEEEIASFKLKLSSMINQESRIEENLVTMVLLFSECQALRDRIKLKQSEINEVRKSFIQMTVAGEIQSNKMSRLIYLAKHEDKVEISSSQRSERGTPKQFETAPFHQYVQNTRLQSQPAGVFEKIEQNFKKSNPQSCMQYESQRHEITNAPVQQVYIGSETQYHSQHDYELHPVSVNHYELNIKPTYHQEPGYQLQDFQDIPTPRELVEDIPKQQTVQYIQNQQQIQEPASPDSGLVAGSSSRKSPEATRREDRSGTFIMQLQQQIQRQNHAELQQAQHIQQIHHIHSINQVQHVQNQNRGFINIKIQNANSQVVVPQHMTGSYPRVINSYPHPHLHSIHVSNPPSPHVSQVRVLNSSSSQPLTHLQRSSHQVYQVGPVYLPPGALMQGSGIIVQPGASRSLNMGSPLNQQKI